MQFVYIDNGPQWKIAHNAEQIKAYIDWNRTKSILWISILGHINCGPAYVGEAFRQRYDTNNIDYLSASRGKLPQKLPRSQPELSAKEGNLEIGVNLQAVLLLGRERETES